MTFTIAYASRFGSTAKLAQHLAEALHNAGATTQVIARASIGTKP